MIGRVLTIKELESNNERYIKSLTDEYKDNLDLLIQKINRLLQHEYFVSDKLDNLKITLCIDIRDYGSFELLEYVINNEDFVIKKEKSDHGITYYIVRNKMPLFPY